MISGGEKIYSIKGQGCTGEMESIKLKAAYGQGKEWV